MSHPPVTREYEPWCIARWPTSCHVFHEDAGSLLLLAAFLPPIGQPVDRLVDVETHAHEIGFEIDDRVGHLGDAEVTLQMGVDRFNIGRLPSRETRLLRKAADVDHRRGQEDLCGGRGNRPRVPGGHTAT